MLLFCLVVVTSAVTTADVVALTIASNWGDPVSDSPTGPWSDATGPYLGGDPRYPQIPGAAWIWMDGYISSWPDFPLYFPKTIELPPGATGITATMEITADNFFHFSVNDSDYGGTHPPDTRQWENIYSYPVTNLEPGWNDLMVRGWESIPGTASGVVYKLTISYVVAIEEDALTDGRMPKSFCLSQNYPNPVINLTTIQYALPKGCRVTLCVYNVSGQKVVTLVDEEQEAGYRSVSLSTDELSVGVYFYRLHAGSRLTSKKMIVVK